MATHEVNLKLSSAQILCIGLTLGIVIGASSGIAAFRYGWNNGGSGNHQEADRAVVPLSKSNGITGFSSSQVREYAGRLMWIADIKAACEKKGEGTVEVNTVEDADYFERVCATPSLPPAPPQP